MSSPTTSEVRQHLAGLALANEFEVAELRRAPIELKLRQLWALMRSADLFEDPAQREADVARIRERWDRLCRALNV